MSRLLTSVALGLVLTGTAASAAPSPVPTNLSEPATHGAVYFALEEGQQQPLAQAIQVDLNSGAGTAACQGLSGWTGQATYHNTELGTLNYWGTGQGCMPYGFGTVQYPDGSLYFGAIGTYFDDWGVRAFLRGRVRPLVRDGVGQYYDARTGQQQIGRFQRDQFVQDLSNDATFTAALQAASASIADRAAPRWTPAIRHFLFAWKPAALAAAPAAHVGHAAQLPSAARTSDQASVTPSHHIPAALYRLPGVAKAEEVFQRYRNKAPGSLEPSFKGGLFGGRCKLAPGADLVLRFDEPIFDQATPRTVCGDGYNCNTVATEWAARAYVGESVGGDCTPGGYGRIDTSRGAWFGPVAVLAGTRNFPVPNGVGLFQASKGATPRTHSTYFVIDWRYIPPDHSGPRGRLRFQELIGAFGLDGEASVFNFTAYAENAEFDPWSASLTTAVATRIRSDGIIARGPFDARLVEGEGSFVYTDMKDGTRFVGEGGVNYTGFNGRSTYAHFAVPRNGLQPGYYRNKKDFYNEVKMSDRDTNLATAFDRITKTEFDRAVTEAERTAWAAIMAKWASKNQAMQANVDRMHQRQAQQARQEELDRAEAAASFSRTMVQLQQSVAEGNARMQQTQQTAQGYIQRANQIEAQKRQWDEGVRQHNAQQKAELEGVVDAANSVKTPEYYANMKAAAAASGQTAQPPASGDDDAGPGVGDQRGAPKLPQGQQYGAIKDECGQLGRDLMSAKYQLEQRCLRQKRDDETFTAWRDAQNSCMADGKGEVDGLQVAYSACSKRDPSEGGVVRY
jgi:hypothetical protein